MSKPVYVEYTRDGYGYGKGERFVVASAAKAKEVHPHAKITGHEDGTDYEEPKPRADAKAEAPPKAEKPAEGDGAKG